MHSKITFSIARNVIMIGLLSKRGDVVKRYLVLVLYTRAIPVTPIAASVAIDIQNRKNHILALINCKSTRTDALRERTPQAFLCKKPHIGEGAWQSSAWGYVGTHHPGNAMPEALLCRWAPTLITDGTTDGDLNLECITSITTTIIKPFPTNF